MIINPGERREPAARLQDAGLVVGEQQPGQAAGAPLHRGRHHEELSPRRQGQEHVHHRGVKGQRRGQENHVVWAHLEQRPEQRPVKKTHSPTAKCQGGRRRHRRLVLTSGAGCWGGCTCAAPSRSLGARWFRTCAARTPGLRAPPPVTPRPWGRRLHLPPGRRRVLVPVEPAAPGSA